MIAIISFGSQQLPKSYKFFLGNFSTVFLPNYHWNIAQKKIVSFGQLLWLHKKNLCHSGNCCVFQRKSWIVEHQERNDFSDLVFPIAHNFRLIAKSEHIYIPHNWLLLWDKVELQHPIRERAIWISPMSQTIDLHIYL